MNELISTDPWKIRSLVGQWLRIKGSQSFDSGDMWALVSRISWTIKNEVEQASQGKEVDVEALSLACVRLTLQQLSPDADHSDLLHRLLTGGEVY